MKKWQEASKSTEVGAKRIVLWCLLLCFTQSDSCKFDKSGGPPAAPKGQLPARIPRVQQSKSNTESRRFMLSHVSHVLYQMVSDSLQCLAMSHGFFWSPASGLALSLCSPSLLLPALQ